MKYQILLVVVLVASASAAIVPRIAAVRDCGGPNSLASVNGTVNTDPVPVPGDMLLSLTLVQTIDSPDDLIIKKVTTRKTDNYEVPCFEQVSGSCTIPLCEAIAIAPGLICPLFPPAIPCECPIKAGVYFSPNSVLAFSAGWNDPTNIPGGANGDYTSRVEFLTGADNTVLGCVDVDFTLKAV